MTLFSESDKELIFAFAERLTGSCQQGDMRKEILVSNVSRRMSENRILNLNQYLNFALDNAPEYQHLLSALTIHTTSWFREKPHFKMLFDFAIKFAQTNRNEMFKVWCAACSTGEEVYSFAAVLEEVSQRISGFKYEILGSDIDPISVAHAQKALYAIEGLRDIPQDYKKSFLKGSGPTAQFMTLKKSVRAQCKFEVRNLTKESDLVHNITFQFIVCRNVLIYFEPDQVIQIVKNLAANLDKETGFLCLGHSESVPAEKLNIELVSNCVYRVRMAKNADGTKAAAKSILILDESHSSRSVVSRVLSGDDFVTHIAENTEQANHFLANGKIDLILVSAHKLEDDFLKWFILKRQANVIIPAVIIADNNSSEVIKILSSFTNSTQEIMEKKNFNSDSQSIIQLIHAILEPKKKKSNILRNGFQKPAKLYYPEIIVIGSSTGGTEALVTLLQNLPANCPPVLIVQHISPAFALPFRERLAQAAHLKLGSMSPSVPLQSGHLYMAEGDHHIEIQRRGGTLFLRCSNAPPIASHRPAVEILFMSTVAAKTQALAVLLTGMGADGSKGMLSLHKQGLLTCAQDEASCVVYGMPKEAITLGAASFIGNLTEIRRVINDCLSTSHAMKISDKKLAS